MHSDQFLQFTNVLEPDSIDFEAYLKETDDSEKVRPAYDFLDQVMFVLAPTHDMPQHPKLPFSDSWLYFAPGEVTVWGGFNGSGKSMLQGQVLTHFARAGQKVCIASFEMKPAKTLARIVKQELCISTPPRHHVDGLLRQLNGTMWLYDQQGTVKPERMIAVIKHCAEKLGCQHIAIDSLMKCVRGTDDYNGQKEFVDQLTSCARDYNVHIHLVAHLKKGDGDERLPNRMDISGAGAISDLVDNVVLVWRNKRKERDRDAGKTINEDDPDSVLIVDKSRNGEWEGRTKLWFNKASQRFSDGAMQKRGLARSLA